MEPPAAGSDATPAPAPPPPRKSTPGQPWGQAETFHLIDAYEELWHALKRGQLKSNEWDDVATIVAARSGTGVAGAPPAKSGLQCRHKIEKLRKRYRSERARPVRSFWPFFDRMDRLDRGPLPISVLPPPRRPAIPSSDEDEPPSNTRSINGLLREQGRGFKSKVVQDDDQEEEEMVLRRRAASQLAATVRRLGEEIVRMEKRKMELIREIERDRMEMESRREKMVMESQRYLVERIAQAFASVKKAKKSHNSFE